MPKHPDFPISSSHSLGSRFDKAKQLAYQLHLSAPRTSEWTRSKKFRWDDLTSDTSRQDSNTNLIVEGEVKGNMRQHMAHNMRDTTLLCLGRETRHDAVRISHKAAQLLFLEMRNGDGNRSCRDTRRLFVERQHNVQVWDGVDEETHVS